MVNLVETYIVKSIIQGAHLAIYSSIKPGSHHKLKLDPEIDILMSNLYSAIDFLVEAVEAGERIRRGELAVTGLELGNMLSKALRESYRWNGGRVYPSIIVPEIIYSIALSHSDIDSVLSESGKLRKSLELVLSISRWSDIKRFLEALKAVEREDMFRHLESAGVTQLSGVEGQVNYHEVFRVLGSRWYGFLSLDTYEYRVIDYVKELLNYYKKYGNAENAIIALYLNIIRDKIPDYAKKLVDEAFQNNLMLSRDGAKKLYELDNLFRKNNIVFNEYTGLLAIVASLAVFEGLRP